MILPHKNINYSAINLIAFFRINISYGMVANKILLSIIIMLVMIGCGKQKEKKQLKVGKQIILTPVNSSITNQQIKTNKLSKEKVNEKEVDSLVSKFSSMLDGFIKFAGGNTYMRTNRIDVEEFVKGKTDKELYTFVRKTLHKSPYASKQVCEFLLERIIEDTKYLKVSHTYTTLLTLIGDENDIARAKSICKKIKKIYINSDKYQTFKEREDVIIIMNAYGMILLDDKMRNDIVDTIRKYGKTPEEQSAADYYDAMLKIESGTPENLKNANALLENIRKRGKYSYYDATHKDVKDWLDNFDDWTSKIKELEKNKPKNFLGITKN